MESNFKEVLTLFHEGQINKAKDICLKILKKEPNNIDILNLPGAIAFKNIKKQITELKKFIKDWNQNEDLILVTHYVVILEILNLTTNSGDIVFFDKKYNVLKVINTLN